jgi:hypothetical protein
MVESLSDFKIYVIETDLDVTMLFAHEYWVSRINNGP